ALILADTESPPFELRTKTWRTAVPKRGSHLLSSGGPRLTMSSAEVKIGVRAGATRSGVRGGDRGAPPSPATGARALAAPTRRPRGLVRVHLQDRRRRAPSFRQGSAEARAEAGRL